MNDPKCDKKVSWLELSRSETKFCRCAAGMVADKRWEIDCRLTCTEDGREKDRGRDEELAGYVVDMRL